MEEKKKGNGVLIGVLIVIILGLVGYIVYDKVLQTKKISSNDKSNGVVQENNDNSVENSNASSDRLLAIVADLAEKTFRYSRQEAYCGENMNWKDATDVINNENNLPTYAASNDFTSLEELKSYLSSFWSSSFISKSMYIDFVNGYNSIEKYKEKDGKLYCYNSLKDCAPIYNSEKSTFKVDLVADNNTYASGKIAADSCGNYLGYYDITMKIIIENGNWVVDDYTEKLGENVYVGEN